jgi:transposase
VYYRLVNGNITDVKSMSLCVKEMEIRENVVFIADKGFFSASNIAMMEAEKLSCLIPMRRDNPLIDYSPLLQDSFKKSMSYFAFQDRIIWYYSHRNGGHEMVTFLDDVPPSVVFDFNVRLCSRTRVRLVLKVNEEKDYLQRIQTHPETYSKDAFNKKLHRFGTLTIVHNLKNRSDKGGGKTDGKRKNEKCQPFEQTVYESYKMRNEIEVMFDSYKNYLAADVSYMQNRYVMEGWLFANFIAMICYYKLYAKLKEAELLAKYSPKDIIELSKSIYKMKIRGVWHQCELTQKTVKLFEKIGIGYLT